MKTLLTESELRALLGGLLARDLSGVSIDADLGRELGLDSLAKLRLLAGIEKRLEVRFPDAALGRMRTMRDVLAALPTTVNGKDGAP